MNIDEFNKINNINISINDINSNNFFNNSKIIPLKEENENDKENLNLFNNDDFSSSTKFNQLY